MNLIAILILVFLAVDTALHAIADGLNLRNAHEDLPEPFVGIYDPERYRTSQQYLKATTRFSAFTGAVDLGVLILFWQCRGFQMLDTWARSLGAGPISTGLVFIGALILIKSLISLPFSIYSTFVIEERFGFNRTTWQTFVTDCVKGLVLGLVIGTPLLAGVLYFFTHTGAWAWWYCWIAVTLFTLIMQYIVPVWIMPLFNKFEPLEAGPLKDAILAAAEKIAFPLDNVMVMDGSKRSAKSNAFFTGFGRNRRIVLFDTLIRNHSIQELVAVLAHEMGHYKKGHIKQMLVIRILHTGVLLFLLSLVLSYAPLYEAFYIATPGIHTGLIFFGLLFSPVELVLAPLMNALSRKNEYAADRFSAETTGAPEDLISALKQLTVDNLSNLTPHPFYVWLHYSHPPILKRIDALTIRP